MSDNQTPTIPEPGPLGKLLRNLREKRGLSIDELASKSKVSRSSLFAIESGASKTLTMKNLKRLSGPLRVSIARLAGEAR